MPRFISALLMTVTLATVGCEIDADYHDMYGNWEFAEPVTHVSADIDASNLFIVPTTDSQSSVDLAIEWTHEKPTFAARLEGTTLYIDLDCKWDCRGSIEARVPMAASIDAEVGAGDIDIHEIDGDVIAWAGAGNVSVKGI